MTRHYHIGQNIPGYMPMSDPYIVTTKRDAVAALIDEKERVLDSDMGFHDSPPRATLHCVGNARRDLSLFISDDSMIHDLGLSLWADVCTDTREDCYEGYEGF